MAKYFTTKDPLDTIITETLPDHKILHTEHILTGWTNIVIEVTTDKGAFFNEVAPCGANEGMKTLTAFAN